MQAVKALDLNANDGHTYTDIDLKDLDQNAIETSSESINNPTDCREVTRDFQTRNPSENCNNAKPHTLS